MNNKCPPRCRFESGTYFGEDDSNIKLELSCVKMPAPRKVRDLPTFVSFETFHKKFKFLKVSKMINGLGEDM